MRPVDMLHWIAEHDDHHLATIRHLSEHLITGGPPRHLSPVEHPLHPGGVTFTPCSWKRLAVLPQSGHLVRAQARSNLNLRFMHGINRISILHLPDLHRW
jgi:hypothetical protein